MPSPRLMAILTAAILAGSANSGQAGYSVRQLREIDRLITAQDCGGLWNYLYAHPEIMDGDDPLAVELRNYLKGINNGLIKCLSVNPAPRFGPPVAGAAGSY